MTVSPFDLNCVLTPREQATDSQKNYQDNLVVARQAIVDLEGLVVRCREARDRTPPCRLQRALDKIAAELDYTRLTAYREIYDEETVNESGHLG